MNFPLLDEPDVYCRILEAHDNYALVQYPDERPTRVNIRFGGEIRRRATNA